MKKIQHSTKLWIIFIFTCLSLNTQGQGWDMTYGNPDERDHQVESFETADGSIYVVSSDRDNSRGVISLAKISANGELIWEKTYDDVMGLIHIQYAGRLSNGNFLIAGYFYEQGDRGLRFIEVDEAGEVVNFKSKTHNSSDYGPYLVTLTTDEHLIAVGPRNNADYNTYLKKYALDGTTLATHLHDLAPENHNYFGNEGIVATSDGGAAIIGELHDDVGDTLRHRLVKFTEDGAVDWIEDFTPCHSLKFYALQQMANDDLVVLAAEGFYTDTSSSGTFSVDFDYFLKRINNLGEEQWKLSTAAGSLHPNRSVTRFGLPLLEDDNQELILWAERYPVGMVGARIDVAGNVVDVKDVLIEDGVHVSYSTLLTSDNHFLVAGDYNPISGESDIYFFKTDAEFNLIWDKSTNVLNYESCQFLKQLNDGNYLGVGRYSTSTSNTDNYIVKIDTAGHINEKFVEGNIFFDQVENCEQDDTEIPLVNWIVAVTGTPPNYAVSDSMGYYWADNIDDQDLALSLTPPNPYWEACENPVLDTFPAGSNTVQADFPLQAIIDCPYMEVDIGSARLRYCEDGEYVIRYCNTGTIPSEEEDSYIELNFDSTLTITGASVDWTATGHNSYIVPIGSVASLECGSFTVAYHTGCDTTQIGAARCSDAHIFPDTICDPMLIEYQGAFIELSATCETDSLYFKIKNTGDEPMDIPSNFIVIEDAVLLQNGAVTLETAMEKTLAVPANGSTYHLQVEQVTGAPGQQMPIIGIEGCGLNGSGTFSTGFLNQFPFGNEEPTMDMDCRTIVASWDPNEKLAFPIGYGEEHYINQNQALDYQINFQNTGTATAFKVVLKDTLSPLLDPSTLQVGAASHPFDYKLYGNGILEFTFDPIALPDSNANEAASHGFVQYHIQQQPDNPLESIILNRAGIYFDNNPVVITNYTMHTIGRPFFEIVSVEYPEASPSKILVYPNPMATQAVIDLQGFPVQQGQLSLYNIAGQLVRRLDFAQSPFVFDKNGLGDGLYFFKIESGGRLMGSGKLMVR